LAVYRLVARRGLPSRAGFDAGERLGRGWVFFGGIMKRSISWWVAGVVLTASCTCLAEEFIDGIAAQVGEEIVLFSEVIASVADIEAKMRDAGLPDNEIADLRSQGLERMIEEKIVRSEVRRMELYASDQEISNAIEMIAQENGITVEQLVASVTAKGLALQEYRESLGEKLEHQKVIQAALLPRVEVEKSEIEALFEERFGNQPAGGTQVHLRQLLIPAPSVAQMDSVCAQTRDAAKRIAEGETFELVASQVSVVSPERGGDIGWLHAKTLSSWMSALIDPLEPGETSVVSQQSFGCTILKLVERRDFEPITFERAESRLYQEIEQEKLEVEYIKWMDELRKNIYIKRRGFSADAANLDDPTSQPSDAAESSLYQ
jgi:peptidyl-prolyl cis-trans isomerase SurA